MYRDDEVAHVARASSLIDEIAELERQKLAQAANDLRLEAAKRELAALHVQVPSVPIPERTPGWLAHMVVFATSMSLAYAGYTLLA